MTAKITTVSIAMLALLAAGCSSSETPDGAAGETTGRSVTSGQQGAESVDASAPAEVEARVVRGMREYDYAPTSSIVQAASEVAVTIEGAVVDWSDGRSTVESDGSGYEGIAYTAVLKVRIADAHSGEIGGDEFAYIEVPRGDEIRVDGQTPEGTEPVVTSIDELSAAVPAGTPVIILAEDALTAAQLSSETPGLEVRDDGKGLPAGAAMLQPSVQGLLFEDSNGDFVSGMADDEEEWGWIPRGVDRDERFDYLGEQLNEL